MASRAAGNCRPPAFCFGAFSSGETVTHVAGKRYKTAHDPVRTHCARRAMTTPVALTIAGSDSSGGAGIQADLKTFAALGVYGASAITALTAQNTRGVTGIHALPAAFVTAPIDAVFSDLHVAAMMIGILAPAPRIHETAHTLPLSSQGL